MNFNLFKKKEKTPTLNIKLKKLHPDAVVPSYAHNGDVGMDMTAVAVDYDAETDTYIYHTGLAFESDFNIGQFLFLRSGNSKKECYLTNGVGIADSAIYRGEIQFRMKNRDGISFIAEMESQKVFISVLTKELSNWNGNKNSWYSTFTKAREEAVKYAQDVKNNIYERAKKLEFAPYKVGDRVGQMVFLNYPNVNISVVNELSDTVRGSNGFGSTGN